MSQPTKAIVTVPATTANLGPAFDCLGLALGLYTTITVEKSTSSSQTFSISIAGKGENSIPRDESNLMARVARSLFNEIDRPPQPLHIHQQNDIPVGCGLGSSAASALGALLAVNALLGHPLTEERILALAADVEGHPDNVAPAYHGGLTLVNQREDMLHVEAIPIPELTVVVVVPDRKLLTSQARAALPEQVPLSAAVFNIGRAALLVRALEEGNYDQLAVAMEDRIHQPYRIPLIPGMTDAFVAAMEAGASGVALSGSGPGIIALAPDGHVAIGQAISATFSANNIDSETWILPAEFQGSVVTVES